MNTPDQSACKTLAERTWSALDGLASADAEYMPFRTRAVRGACAYCTDMAFALHIHGEKALCDRMTAGQTRLMYMAAGYIAAGEMGLADEAECQKLAKEAMRSARPMWARTPREQRCVDKELAASWRKANLRSAQWSKTYGMLMQQWREGKVERF
jgi:hypothetical protein